MCVGGRAGPDPACGSRPCVWIQILRVDLDPAYGSRSRVYGSTDPVCGSRSCVRTRIPCANPDPACGSSSRAAPCPACGRETKKHKEARATEEEEERRREAALRKQERKQRIAARSWRPDLEAYAQNYTLDPIDAAARDLPDPTVAGLSGAERDDVDSASQRLASSGCSGGALSPLPLSENTRTCMRRASGGLQRFDR